MRRFLGSFIVVAALIVGSSGAASAAPPAVRCGDTIAGTVTLTRSLRCTGVAFYIDGPPEVVLDLAGFTVRGPGADSGIPTISYPVELSDAGLVLTVRNGAIRGWGTILNETDRATVTTTTVTVVDVGAFTAGETLWLTIQSSRYRNAGNVSAYDGWVRMTDSVFDGTWIGGGVRSSAYVTRSTIKNVPGTAVETSEGNIEVTDSAIVNSGTAIGAYWTSVDISNSVIKGNDIGVSTSLGGSLSGYRADTIVNSSFVGNGTALELGVAATVTGNTFSRNDRAVDSRTVDRLLPARIELNSNVLTHNGDAIYVDGPSVLTSNRAVTNRGIGIYTPDATDLGGNIAYLNGVSPQCTGAVCSTRTS